MIVSDIIKEFSPHLFWDVDRSNLISINPESKSSDKYLNLV
jgi:hypothetical protein